MLRTLSLTATLLFTSGCVTADSGPSDIDFSVEDLTEERSLRLTLRNLLSEDICISKGDWPNASGLIRNEGVLVSLVVGDRRYGLIASDSFGECFDFENEGLCEHRIAPGARLTATIPYENFSIPSTFWNSPKVLVYEPFYYPCDEDW